jgi:hypothetical protein
MFSVLFEVCPKSDQWDAYLDYAKMLRPELEIIDGFIDNVRYRSLTRKGWILSLSTGEMKKLSFGGGQRCGTMQCKIGLGATY